MNIWGKIQLVNIKLRPKAESASSRIESSLCTGRMSGIARLDGVGMQCKQGCPLVRIYGLFWITSYNNGSRTLLHHLN